VQVNLTEFDAENGDGTTLHFERQTEGVSKPEHALCLHFRRRTTICLLKRKRFLWHNKLSHAAIESVHNIYRHKRALTKRDLDPDFATVYLQCTKLWCEQPALSSLLFRKII
jgi:hypothetical protein